MKVGFTGHQNAPAVALDMLAVSVREILDARTDACGLSSLAAGADQAFAELLINDRVPVHAVIPCDGYDTTFDTDEDRRQYAVLLQAAATVTVLPFPAPSEEAFLAAGIVVAERCEVLLAAWDGKPAAGLGGTADVVAYARQLGKRVEIVWPEGVTR